MAEIRSDRRDPAPSRQQTIYTAPETREHRAETESSDEKTTIGVLTGGSSLEAIGGGAAIVLAIIGLTGFVPLYMAGIATIAIGAALLAHGAALAARWKDTVRRFSDRRYDEVSSDVGTEVFGGVVGIVLGVLALAGVWPDLLLPIAAIVFGGALLLGGPVQPELADLARDRDPRMEHATRNAMKASGGVMSLVGIGAVVLGVLGLIDVGPALVLSMVSMLAIGGALLLAGGTSTARFGRRLAQAS